MTLYFGNLTPQLEKIKNKVQDDNDELTLESGNYHFKNNNYQVGSNMMNSRSPSCSLDKTSSRTLQNAKSLIKSKYQQPTKLPSIQQPISYDDVNPEIKNKNSNKSYYMNKLYRSLKKNQINYTMSLFRQHFYQNIQTIRLYKNLKVLMPKKINLDRRNKNFKTIYLDLDQTLIHTNEQSTKNCSIKLNFPIEGYRTITAGVHIRPHCSQFLQQLSKIAQIIIFTASSSSYADIVLDYLDPKKTYISHRLYRQHCTLQKGFYLKDLRCINRSLENALIVDNLAFCYILQPENGIPILPFYHHSLDKQLLSLLQFLKQAVKYPDMRDIIKQTFFWHKYVQKHGDARKIFFNNYVL